MSQGGRHHNTIGRAIAVCSSERTAPLPPVEDVEYPSALKPVSSPCCAYAIPFATVLQDITDDRDGSRLLVIVDSAQ